MVYVCVHQVCLEPYHCSAFVYTTRLSTWNKRSADCQEADALVDCEYDVFPSNFIVDL